MSKRRKGFLVLLTMLGIFVGIIGLPQSSKADRIYTHQGHKLRIEFVNKQGKDFPRPLELRASIKKYTVDNYAHNFTYYGSQNLAITKDSNKNIFYLQIPDKANLLVSTNNHEWQVISDMVMGPSLATVTDIQYYSGTYRRYDLNTGIETITNLNANPGNHVFEKNSFGTWNIWLDGKAVGSIYSYDGMGWGRFVAAGIQQSYYYYGMQGDYMKLKLITPQVKEVFEDDTGAPIPAPTGYTNNNYIDVIYQPQSYKMVNDSSLPKTYTDSGYIYTYKGWYKGAGKQGSMLSTHPPSISFNAGLIDAENEVHVVYTKRALRTIDEEYIDSNSTMIESSWNTGQTMADGNTFTGTPAATKTDSGGVLWEYQGWKLGTEAMSAMRPKTTPVSHVISANTKIQYVYKKKQHTLTEKWVDQTDGTTLVPLATNPKTSSIDDNDPFNGSATTTITDTNSGIWDFVGWENVTDAAGTVVPAGTPLAISNIKGSKEIRYHYKARNTTATLDLKPTPQVLMSGGNVAWSSRLTNTGSSALNSLKLKATSNWAAGLIHPTLVTVTPAGGTAQNFTVAPGAWTSGIDLTGVNISNVGPNNYADITFSTQANGGANKVLPAEIEVTGNMANPLKADNFVRIDDPDEPNLKPTGNTGLINIPEFEFGEVEVKPYAQTKGLDAAAYQSGYAPYIRFMDNESTGGWNLTAKLGQFTSGSKTLPTTTAIKLRNGILMEVQNYNKHNETEAYVGIAGSASIPSDGTTVALTNGGTQGVYQLEYALNNVELDLMAHSGVAGLSYSADMDWTLTTAP